MGVVLLIVVAVVVVGLIAWFFTGRHPNHGEGGPPTTDDSRSDRLYTDSRPAGPDAESMAPEADPRPPRRG
jgi:hypothetical protein